jgi:hypothetical protein
VSTGIGPPFLQSPDVLATAAGPFSDIIVSVERTEKKRNYFTCTGYLGKKKNLDYLSQKESNIKTKKKGTSSGNDGWLLFS